MPFPANLEEMYRAGYKFERTEPCPVCSVPVDIFKTPGGREIAMQRTFEIDVPAVRHYEVCNPNSDLPPNRDALQAAVWVFLGRLKCEKCGRAVEKYNSPDGRTFIFEPMMGGDWPTVIHKCNIAPKGR
jgi:hypothetical protein